MYLCPTFMKLYYTPFDAVNFNLYGTWLTFMIADERRFENFFVAFAIRPR
jgi:hypothetical protein